MEKKKKGQQDVTWPLFRQTVSYVLIVMERQAIIFMDDLILAKK